MNETNGKADALKTYVEQTKLLVTLASGFLIAPAAALPLFRQSDSKPPLHLPIKVFAIAEAALIFSVVAGYAVLGSIAGTQHNGVFDVYRPATRALSLLQLILYLIGLSMFVVLIIRLA
jgi:hypothetical protein